MSIKSNSWHPYLQVINHLKQEMTLGVYKENEKLSAEFDLATN